MGQFSMDTGGVPGERSEDREEKPVHRTSRTCLEGVSGSGKTHLSPVWSFLRVAWAGGAGTRLCSLGGLWAGRLGLSAQDWGLWELRVFLQVPGVGLGRVLPYGHAVTSLQSAGDLAVVGASPATLHCPGCGR